MHCEMLSSAGMLPMSTVAAPATHGLVVAGMQGMGVSTPEAAVVAVATVGLVREEHMPKVGMFTIGTWSMIVAAGVGALTRLAGRTMSEQGAAPKLHCNMAPMTTCCGMGEVCARAAARAIADFLPCSPLQAKSALTRRERARRTTPTMSALDNFLEPVSPDNECGEDISYDPNFLELDTLVLGKPEGMFGGGEPPDWKLIRERCRELLGRSKHLRVVVTLAGAELRMSGVPGFRDGIVLLKGLVDRYWEGLYPRLDPEDNNDPTERVNIMTALAMPPGAFGDPLKFIDALRVAPLTQSMQMGRYSLADLQAAQAGTPPAEGKPATTVAQVEAAFRDTKPETLEALNAALLETTAAVKALRETVGNLIGMDRAPEFDPLVSVLREMQRTVSPYLAVAAPADLDTLLDELPAGGGGAVSASAPRAALAGQVNTREDVLKGIDLICEYYARTEPSSPVPLLLQRAKRLVNLDFLKLLEDLSPDALTQINVIAGIK